jgi:UDP-N-acetylmuramoyl-tripeptide--D-alanyl-D-alanine ligase
MLKTSDFIEAITAKRPGWNGHGITGGVADSRLVFPGCVFVALPGETTDGHNYVSEAFKNGASLAIIQQEIDRFQYVDLRTSLSPFIQEEPDTPYCLLVNNSLSALQQVASFWRQKLNVKVIGVTGSVGKSTTKELIYDVLSTRYCSLKNEGNLNNEIGLPLTILSLNESHERAVLEMGFYVLGEIAFLCAIARPAIGVITNIGTVHAERAGSTEVIAQGKSELIQALPPAPVGMAILNYDDVMVRAMKDVTCAKVFFYGLDPQADLWADHVESLGLDGIRLRLHYRNEVIYVRVPMLGRHSVHTVLRATAVGLVEGLTWQEIVLGLRSEHAQLRLVSARTQSGAVLIDDTYNASPESTLAALNLLADLEGHKIAVLGDMLELGQYELEGHELVGLRAAEVVDLLITVGERSKMIADSACHAGLDKTAIIEVDDAPQVVELLQGLLKAGDVVLIKGSRGMRMDRIVQVLEHRQ